MLIAVTACVVIVAALGVKRIIRFKRMELVHGPAPVQVVEGALVVLIALVIGSVYLRG